MSHALKSLGDIVLQQHFSQLPTHMYQWTQPTPLAQPRLLSANARLAHSLGIKADSLSADLLADWLSGHSLPKGAKPLAMKYTGHQFGQYNPDLGDGRGLLLGEWQAPDGVLYDFHLKGAGQTAYSRFGDGRAVVRSCVREYLVSEALHALGIPSTRALALCASPEPIQRETLEPAATLLRITPCHIRFGHFEYLYHQKPSDLLTLAKYCLARFYPDQQTAVRPVAALFRSIAERTAHTVAMWQAYGFLHGVLNTDNMSILGETFDHGPFAFIDRWQDNCVYNHTDHLGRYAFGKQPSIVLWNLACLAQALSPLCENTDLCRIDDLSDGLDHYDDIQSQQHTHILKQRLGLTTSHEGDRGLIEDWLNLLQGHALDANAVYRSISHAQHHDTAQFLDHLKHLPSPLQAWLARYHRRTLKENNNAEQRRHQMLSINPSFVLRTHVTQDIIHATHQGDLATLNDALQYLQRPFDEHPIPEHWTRAPDDTQTPVLSCSS